MLGSMSDAEDVLQDAYLKWSKAMCDSNLSQIDNVEAYLTSVVSRLCLDRLRHRKVEKQVYVGPWLPEPVPEDNHTPDVDLSQWQSVQTALLVLLESLPPKQRAVFTLSEVFEYSHQEIAELLDISPANSRQLLRRARRDVSEQSLPEAGTEKHVPVFEKFYEALIDGDVNVLNEILTEDVVAYSDGGGKATAAIIPLEGIDRVVTVFSHVTRKIAGSSNWYWRSVNGQLGLVIEEKGVVTSVTTFAMQGAKIHRIFMTRNPDKLNLFIKSQSAGADAR